MRSATANEGRQLNSSQGATATERGRSTGVTSSTTTSRSKTAVPTRTPSTVAGTNTVSKRTTSKSPPRPSTVSTRAAAAAAARPSITPGRAAADKKLVSQNIIGSKTPQPVTKRGSIAQGSTEASKSRLLTSTKPSLSKSSTALSSTAPRPSSAPKPIPRGSTNTSKSSSLAARQNDIPQAVETIEVIITDPVVDDKSAETVLQGEEMEDQKFQEDNKEQNQEIEQEITTETAPSLNAPPVEESSPQPVENVIDPVSNPPNIPDPPEPTNSNDCTADKTESNKNAFFERLSAATSKSLKTAETTLKNVTEPAIEAIVKEEKSLKKLLSLGSGQESKSNSNDEDEDACLTVLSDKELIQMMNGSIEIQSDVLHSLYHHFLEPMRIRNQLSPSPYSKDTTAKSNHEPVSPIPGNVEPPSPAKGGGHTLLEAAIYQKLARLGAILEEMIPLEKSFNTWWCKYDLPARYKKIIEIAYLDIKQITKELGPQWTSHFIKITAAECLRCGKTMELRLSELHIRVEQLLDVLARLAVTLKEELQKKKQFASIEPSPLTSIAVASLESSLPTKLLYYDEVKKSIMNGKEKTES